MDPAVFAPFQPQQHGSGNLYRPHSPQSYSHNGAGANAGPGDSRRTPVSLHRGAGPGSAGGPNGVNGAPGSVMNAPQVRFSNCILTFERLFIFLEMSKTNFRRPFPC